MSATNMTQQHLAYILRLADNALILGQRNSEWCGHGPALEEDIALTNLSLDLIGQSRLLYSHAAALETALTGLALTEDDYAYWRTERQFTNYTLVELPHYGPLAGTAHAEKDYAVTIVRNFLYATLMAHLWPLLERSSDTGLAAIAAKSAKENLYHMHHAQDWLVRLGDGTETSHRRAQSALDYLLPYTNEFFSVDALEDAVAADGIGARGADLKAAWLADISAILNEATLKLPATGNYITTGKLGIHSEHMGYLLAELQSVARQHPGAQW
jgi:ring-1,2-phenylacetyl-CoA epoxidase subunit PaaC